MSKRNKTVKILSSILLVSGILVILIPHLTDFLYKHRAGNIISDFDKSSEQEEDALSELYEIMKQHNITIFEEGQSELKDPFSYEQIGLDLAKYGFEENIVGYVKISKMNVELPIYLGASKENMRLGAVHLSQTSYPIGGNNSNTVIAAHRGMSTTAMFRDIELLKTGDTIQLTNFWETLTYEVVETKIINPNDVHEILIQANRDLVTLITCHPRRANYQRYVVYCQRI